MLIGAALPDAGPSPYAAVGAEVDQIGSERAQSVGQPTLVRPSLLAEPAPGRYAGHDLLREYAAELAGQADPPAALRRLLDGYRRIAHAGAVLLDPAREAPVEPPHRYRTRSHRTIRPRHGTG